MIQQRFIHACLPEIGDQRRRGDGNRNIAQNRNKLGADNIDNQRRQFGNLGIFRAFALLHRGRQRRCGHRRLLGGNGKMQHMNQHKAQRIIHAEHKGLHQWRQNQPRGQNLQRGHGSDNHPGAGGGFVHADKAFFVGADVMLAGFAGVFSHLKRNQLAVGGQQRAHAAFAVQRIGNVDQQRAN